MNIRSFLNFVPDRSAAAAPPFTPAAGNAFARASQSTGAINEIVAVNGAVSSSSAIITVGSGFNFPYGVAVDGSGDLSVADKDNNAVREIVAVNGVASLTSTVNTVGSGFNQPYGVAVDGNGNVFVADTYNNKVKEIIAGAQHFPATPVASASAPLTTYFTFTSSGTLASTPYVVPTQGAQGKDFQASATQRTDACVTGQTYNAGDACTVNVTFTRPGPSSASARCS